MLEAQESLLYLNAQQLREFAAALITKISEQSKQHAQAIAAKDSDILYRQAKIDKLTFELATLKRWKFGHSSPQACSVSPSTTSPTPPPANVAANSNALARMSQRSSTTRLACSPSKSISAANGCAMTARP